MRVALVCNRRKGMMPLVNLIWEERERERDNWSSPRGYLFHWRCSCQVSQWADWHYQVSWLHFSLSFFTYIYFILLRHSVRASSLHYLFYVDIYNSRMVAQKWELATNINEALVINRILFTDRLTMFIIEILVDICFRVSCVKDFQLMEGSRKRK